MRTKSAALLALLASCAVAQTQSLYAPPLGAASLATNRIMHSTGLPVHLALPCDTHELTVTYWTSVREADAMGPGSGYSGVRGVNGTTYTRGGNFLPSLRYCPRVVRSAPDLLEGAWGWGGSAVAVSGARSFAYAFPAPTGTTSAKCFPRGVYTVAWTNLSATMTLTAGGADMTLEAPAGVRNVEPAEADGFILTGSGTGKIGISRAHIHPIFDTGRGDAGTAATAEKDLAALLVATNYCFVANRIRLTEAVHTNAHLIIRQDGRRRATANAPDLPEDGSTILTTEGFYDLSYIVIGRNDLDYAYEWDLRIFPKWLDEEDLTAIYEDGLRTRAAFGYPSATTTNAVYQVDP